MFNLIWHATDNIFFHFKHFLFPLFSIDEIIPLSFYLTGFGEDNIFSHLWTSLIFCFSVGFHRIRVSFGRTRVNFEHSGKKSSPTTFQYPTQLFPGFISCLPFWICPLFFSILICRDFISDSIHTIGWPHSQTIIWLFALLCLGS